MTVEEKKKQLSHYHPLYIAAIKGDWETANNFPKGDPDPFTAPITADEETALIVAVRSVQRHHFVKKLVENMRPKDLELGDCSGRTALHRAAGAGNIAAAQLLVGQNSNLPNLKTNFEQLPLFYAAARGDREMVLYLMRVMESIPLEGESGFRLLHQLTVGKLYDIALTVLQRNPTLAYFIPKNEEDLKFHSLTAMAEKPSSFPSGTPLNLWQSFIYSAIPMELGGDIENPAGFFICWVANVKQRLQAMFWKVAEKFGIPIELENIADHYRERDIENPAGANVKQRLQAMFWKVAEKSVPQIKHIREKKLIHHQARELLRFLCKETVKSDLSNADRIFWLPLVQATAVGTHEIVEEILGSYPDAISLENHKKQTIFQQAIVFRQENVFNLIHQLEESRAIILSKWDISNNNALHLAGYLAPQQQLDVRAGAALKMQRELQWFKEMETLVLPKNKEQRNNDKLTPAQVFTDTHKELVKEGERWMKDTSNSCTIVAALIATVVFAAAITVPGGNNSDGRPIFSQQKAFIVFSTSDALALFSSFASVLMFMSILTSRYAEEDFLYVLPKRLVIGLIALFVSVLSTMAAFGATLYLVFGDNKAWILIPIVISAWLPVTLFGDLQFPLLVDMFRSTYGRGIFGRQSDRMLL